MEFTKQDREAIHERYSHITGKREGVLGPYTALKAPFLDFTLQYRDGTNEVVIITGTKHLGNVADRIAAEIFLPRLREAFEEYAARLERLRDGWLAETPEAA